MAPLLRRRDGSPTRTGQAEEDEMWRVHNNKLRLVMSRNNQPIQQAPYKTAQIHPINFHNPYFRLREPPLKRKG